MININELQKHLDAINKSDDVFDQKRKLLHLAMKALEMANLDHSSINLQAVFEDDNDAFNEWLIKSQKAGQHLISHLSTGLNYLSPDYQGEIFEDKKKEVRQQLELTNQNISKTQTAIHELKTESATLKQKQSQLENENQQLLSLEKEVNQYKISYNNLYNKISSLNQDVSTLTGEQFIQLSQQFIAKAKEISSSLNQENAHQNQVLNNLTQDLIQIQQTITDLSSKTEAYTQATQRLKHEKQTFLKTESILKQTEFDYQQLSQKVNALESQYDVLSTQTFIQLVNQFQTISTQLFKYFAEDFSTKQLQLNELHGLIESLNQKTENYRNQTNELESTNQALLNAEQNLKQIEQAYLNLVKLIEYLKIIQEQYTPEFLEQKFEELKTSERIVLNQLFAINDEIIEQIKVGVIAIQQQYESNHQVVISMQQDLVLFETNRSFANPSYELSQLREEESKLKNTIQSIENRIKNLINQRDEMRRLIHKNSSI